MHLTSAGLWLLASGALQATASCDCFSTPITDRDLYLKCARAHGLCRQKTTASTFVDNQKRPLVIPGGDVLSKFEVCVAKNEFNEELYDTSGDIFCQGLPIHLMADASYDPTSKKHVDSKSFVDLSRTTSGRMLNDTLNKELAKRYRRQNFTVGDMSTWNNTGIEKKVQELNIYTNERFPNTPAFISRIRPQARILRAWTKMVHHKWNTLDRTLLQEYDNYLIPGPGSFYLKDNPEAVKKEKYITSAIRLEHPFVIAGGRFREQYYWDSFFVMEGLLAADMTYLARTTLLNFMDQIKAYGFIPNGARKYYLNRSQPPLFIHMLHAYVKHTGDHYILHEALPLAERELRWWRKNRSVKVFHGEKTHTVYQYRVNATGPRPESYAEDWRSAWCFEKQEDKAPKPEDETKLYSQFASGAESGWDYTARWMQDPFDLPKDNDKDRKNLKQMKTLEILRMIPVDLNSIIHRCHVLMADLYELAKDNESPFASQYADIHREEAAKLNQAIIALHWNSEKAAFYDFLLGEDFGGDKKAHHGEQKPFWSVASLAPYWSGIWPSDLDCAKKESKEKVMEAFSGVRKLLDTYQGPLPATVVESGQQWDFPNSWPPLQYIAIKALESIPQKCIEKTKVNDFIRTEVPEGQLGEKKDGKPWDLPEQPGDAPKPNYYVSHSWRDSMVKTLAMRYITATFCSWNDCGKFPEDRAELIERDNPVLDAALREHPGYMYEKLNAVSPTEPGGGGEYEVQDGFGWTNGVAIWIARQYGAILDDPKCPAPKNPKCPDEPRLNNATMADLVFQV